LPENSQHRPSLESISSVGKSCLRTSEFKSNERLMAQLDTDKVVTLNKEVKAEIIILTTKLDSIHLVDFVKYSW
jgi:hypothetical protein